MLSGVTPSISIHALHEESDGWISDTWRGVIISIHALHEESDDFHTGFVADIVDFNPRSP